MAKNLITFGVKSILKKLHLVATNEIVLAWGHEEQLTAISHTLDMICTKLSDAERQKETEGVMLWLKQLKDVVGEVDNMLDEVHYEILRREVETRNLMFRKVPSLPSLKNFLIRRKMGNLIKNINKKLCEINERANGLGLQNEQASPVPYSFVIHEESGSNLEKLKIVGRDNEKLHIIELLTKSRKEENLMTVFIVGMVGIGKTTLAKFVFNDIEIMGHFDVRVWLCVSVKVEVDSLLAKIYESLTGEECLVPTRENIIECLGKNLGTKKYLLVLDDVKGLEKADWDDFRSCMLEVSLQSGSCILVTSRNLKIGTNIKSENFCDLQGLSFDECWSIFREIAFLEGRSSFSELEAIGLDIVKKCRGLPLLVKIIGGMLRGCNDKEKWLSIKESKVWDLEGEDKVRVALKLSFNNLPSSIVKQCFAYCSIFPNDVFIARKTLIQLWMALGFLQVDETRNKKMEDLGNDIFQILVSNSLFQDVEMDECGYIFRCKIHEIVHDTSLTPVKDDTFCVLVTPRDHMVCIPQVKQLFMHEEYTQKWMVNSNFNTSFRKMISDVFKEEVKAKSLHSLFFPSSLVENISLQDFKCLRILTIRGFTVDKIPNSIGELVHLRYLDFSYTKIRNLPKSIGKLYHLQTLKLCCCFFFEEFPEDVRDLISLRHFEFDAFGQAPKVGQLTSLQTLPFFGVGQENGCKIEELGGMKHLCGKLGIRNLEQLTRKEDASKADLSGKKALNEIEFLWGNNEDINRRDKDVLEGLQPHENVKSLKISNFSGDSFPAWVMMMAIDTEGKWMPLHNLVTVRLSGCCNIVNLPMLGNLEVLQNLVLESMDKLTCLRSSLGQENDVTRSGKHLFVSLKSLELIDMKSLEKWTDDATMNSSTMLSPILEKLVIDRCPKIILLDESHHHPLISLKIKNCENLESILSIEGLTSLESVEISNCPSLLELPDLHEQGHSLKRLEIVHCERLTSLPAGFDSLSLVNEVTLGPFSKNQDSFPSLEGVEKLKTHLFSLHLISWPQWEFIPEDVKYLTELKSLTIEGFGVRELPIWLTNMSSIREMFVVDCQWLDLESISSRAPREADNIIVDHENIRDLMICLPSR